MKPSSEPEVTSGLVWLKGFEDGGLFGGALRSWPYLLSTRQAVSVADYASQYLNRLCELSDHDRGGLVMAARQAKQGMWIAGVRRLEWDSNLFGFGVGRMEPIVSPVVSQLDESSIVAGLALIDRCLTHAEKGGLEHLSARVDARDTLTQICLQKSGFLIMDTMVAYELLLDEVEPAVADPSIRLALSADIEPLTELTEQCFGNRAFNQNRFNSDPAFPISKVKELYANWLRNSISGEKADCVLVYERGDRPVAFLTCVLPTKSQLELGMKHGQMQLSAVNPQCHGLGIYGRLVVSAGEWFRARGVEVVEGSTQLSNLPVHRTWQQLGARLSRSYHTFHAHLRPRPSCRAQPGRMVSGDNSVS